MSHEIALRPVQTPVPSRLGQPIMAVCRNPLLDAHALVFEPVPVGVSLASLRPDAKGPVRCTLNGAPCYPITEKQWRHYVRVARARPDDAKKYLARAIRRALAWQRQTTQPGDIIVWHVVPQDKDALKGIIAIVAAVVAFYFTGSFDIAFKTFLAIYTIGGMILGSSNPADLAQQQGGTLYSTSLTGNQAKLDQPIWRNCGLVKITPPFAAMPYYEYIDADGDNLDNDQYFYAVFAIGVGRHDVIRAFIGRTPLDSYQDILVAQYLPPGTQPSRALCNVVTAGEVGGLELDTGQYVGGYVVCQPQRQVRSVGIDISCPQGLGNGGAALTVSWRVEWCEIDDFGRVVSAWAMLHNETRTASTNTQQRWSNKYDLPGDARAMVRLVRTDVKNTSAGARHTLQWDGLRGYLNEPAPLNADTGYYELVLRASKQLGVQSQRDVSMIVQGYARTWSAEDGFSCELHDWDNYTATRNPAWYLADLWIDPLWGEGRDEAHVNLVGIAAFAAICEERQDRFDYTFADFANAMDAAQLIAGAGRARAFERLGVVTLARDALVTMPRTAFSPRNTQPGSMSVTESTPRPPMLIDGILLEYTSNVTWDIATIECPCPGFTVTDEADPRYNPALPKMSRPVYLRIEGIKGAKHAERTGLYEAYKRFYRRRIAACTTEMQGAVLAFMDAARWQPEIGGFGQSGDVAFWDADTLVMGLTEPLTFSETGHTWLALMRDDGTLTTAVIVLPGPTEYDVQLPAAPDFDMVLDDGTRERPKFFAATTTDELMLITEIADGGKDQAADGEEGAQLYAISGFIDDARVHAGDRHLLPGPGEIQDPVDDGSGGVEGGGVIALVTLKTHTYAAGSTTGGSGQSVSFTLFNDGTAHAQTIASVGTDVEEFPVPSEWMLVPVEVSQAAGFEVYASVYWPTEPAMSGSALNAWLSLDTDRSWTVDNATWPLGLYQFDRTPIALRLQIREVATGIVQADRVIYLTVNVADLGVGG